jgi:hypothetical protein
MVISRPLLVLYLLALLLTGVGYLAIMPAFEGFDETAHFSSLREVADTGKIPSYGRSMLDKEVTNYQGPRAYDSLDPPFDRGLTYSKFFARPDLIADYVERYRRGALPGPYAAGEGLNWEAQHPPLYYMLMAPLTKMTEGTAFVTQIFWLRFASYVLALMGVTLGLLAVRSRSYAEDSAAVVGFVLYPIVLPMFFPEFARMGNDSLCLLLTGLLAFLLSLQTRDKGNRKIAVLTGMTLGFGLLTKAFFIPITAGVALYLLVPLLRKPQEEKRREALTLLWILVPALLIGAGWYVFKFAAYGDIIGSDDAIRLAQRGGLVANLRENGSLYGLLRGLTATVVSWSWAGTWSLTRLPPLIHMPVLVLTAWLVVAFASELRGRPLTDSGWLTVWLFGFFSCGLLYHVIESIAINGNGATPGWYLHVLIPWAAPAIGSGACSIWHHPRVRAAFVCLVSYAFLFQVMALWSQFALFTGCAAKGDDKYFIYSGPAFCLDEIPVLTGRLAVVGWPVVAAIAFSGGMICAVLLFVQMLRRRAHAQKHFR